MRQQLVSLSLAIAALALFWALLFPKSTTTRQTLISPLTTEPGAAGYLALWRWLSAEAVPLMSLRGRYDRLVAPTTALPRSGNLLIATMPQALPARRSEWPSLTAWVRRGNTLLIMAALDDNPQWALLSGQALPQQLRLMTGMDFQVVPAPSTTRQNGGVSLLQQLLVPPQARISPIGRHPLFAGVASVATASDLPAARWRAQPLGDAPLLQLARRVDNGDPVVWLRAYGAGAVIVSAYASPFANQQLGEADNARWIADIVASTLGSDGRVIFDDAHQGLVDYYDPAAFYADPRLHRTLAWVVFFWLVVVLGFQRLHSASTPPRPIDDTAWLRLSAGFLATMVPSGAAARRLFEHFFNSLRRRLQLPQDGKPLWDWLEAQSCVPQLRLAELRGLYGRAYAGRSINLVALQALLLQLSRSLA